MSEHYTVIYNESNIFRYQMISQEKVIVEHFRQELIDICNALDVPREKSFDGSLYMGRLQDNNELIIKYKEDIGYFTLIGERGVFSLMEGFPTKNKEVAKFILLRSEFQTGGFRYELNLRDKLNKEWIGKYSAEYDSRKAAFEYAIKMLNIVFKCLPDDVIAQNTKYMNKWFKSQHWYFDEDKMCFEEIK
jgi:hypothetical protein